MTPGLGILIGIPVAILFSLIGIALYIMGWVVQRNDSEADGIFAKRIGLGILVLTIAISAVAFWPYEAQYHYWTPVSGTVTEVSSRLLPSGDRGAVEQKFVVELQEETTLYGIQDTRAALLKAGDHVDLSCIREYQWASGDHGWNCRWGN